ncbi:hypothetical protein HK102_001412 [Quaeritorhiza haematococci]|nr:hypothetical protein HK102_001412 [Quaeritorhiza haematococci]
MSLSTPASSASSFERSPPLSVKSATGRLITDLPEETLEAIFLYVASPNLLQALSCTCRKFHTVLGGAEFRAQWLLRDPIGRVGFDVMERLDIKSPRCLPGSILGAATCKALISILLSQRYRLRSAQVSTWLNNQRLQKLKQVEKEWEKVKSKPERGRRSRGGAHADSVDEIREANVRKWVMAAFVPEKDVQYADDGGGGGEVVKGSVMDEGDGFDWDALDEESEDESSLDSGGLDLLDLDLPSDDEDIPQDATFDGSNASETAASQATDSLAAPATSTTTIADSSTSLTATTNTNDATPPTTSPAPTNSNSQATTPSTTPSVPTNSNSQPMGSIPVRCNLDKRMRKHLSKFRSFDGNSIKDLDRVLVMIWNWCAVRGFWDPILFAIQWKEGGDAGGVKWGSAGGGGDLDLGEGVGTRYINDKRTKAYSPTLPTGFLDQAKLDNVAEGKEFREIAKATSIRQRRPQYTSNPIPPSRRILQDDYPLRYWIEIALANALRNGVDLTIIRNLSSVLFRCDDRIPMAWCDEKKRGTYWSCDRGSVLSEVAVRGQIDVLKFFGRIIAEEGNPLNTDNVDVKADGEGGCLNAVETTTFSPLEKWVWDFDQTQLDDAIEVAALRLSQIGTNGDSKTLHNNLRDVVRFLIQHGASIARLQKGVETAASDWGARSEILRFFMEECTWEAWKREVAYAKKECENGSVGDTSSLSVPTEALDEKAAYELFLREAASFGAGVGDRVLDGRAGAVAAVRGGDVENDLTMDGAPSEATDGVAGSDSDRPSRNQQRLSSQPDSATSNARGNQPPAAADVSRSPSLSKLAEAVFNLRHSALLAASWHGQVDVVKYVLDLHQCPGSRSPFKPTSENAASSEPTPYSCSECVKMARAFYWVRRVKEKGGTSSSTLPNLSLHLSQSASAPCVRNLVCAKQNEALRTAVRASSEKGGVTNRLDCGVQKSGRCGFVFDLGSPAACADVLKPEPVIADYGTSSNREDGVMVNDDMMVLIAILCERGGADASACGHEAVRVASARGDSILVRYLLNYGFGGGRPSGLLPTRNDSESYVCRPSDSCVDAVRPSRVRLLIDRKQIKYTRKVLNALSEVDCESDAIKVLEEHHRAVIEASKHSGTHAVNPDGSDSVISQCLINGSVCLPPQLIMSLTSPPLAASSEVQLYSQKDTDVKHTIGSEAVRNTLILGHLDIAMELVRQGAYWGAKSQPHIFDPVLSVHDETHRVGLAADGVGQEDREDVEEVRSAVAHQLLGLSWADQASVRRVLGMAKELGRLEVVEAERGWVERMMGERKMSEGIWTCEDRFEGKGGETTSGVKGKGNVDVEGFDQATTKWLHNVDWFPKLPTSSSVCNVLSISNNDQQKQAPSNKEAYSIYSTLPASAIDIFGTAIPVDSTIWHSKPPPAPSKSRRQIRLAEQKSQRLRRRRIFKRSEVAPFTTGILYHLFSGVTNDGFLARPLVSEYPTYAPTTVGGFVVPWHLISSLGYFQSLGGAYVPMSLASEGAESNSAVPSDSTDQATCTSPVTAALPTPISYSGVLTEHGTLMMEGSLPMLLDAGSYLSRPIFREFVELGI